MTQNGPFFPEIDDMIHCWYLSQREKLKVHAKMLNRNPKQAYNSYQYQVLVHRWYIGMFLSQIRIFYIILHVLLTTDDR